jgi:ribosomal protein S17E
LFRISPNAFEGKIRGLISSLEGKDGCRSASDYALNKVRKLAEELLTKYPTMFSTNFEANKKALEQVAVIRNRALRNQLAGAITAMASEIAPPKPQAGIEMGEAISSSSSVSSADAVTSEDTEADSRSASAEPVSQQA